MPKNKVFESTLYDEAWLRRVYADENRNAAQVAALIGCTRQAVLHRLRRYGIPVKDGSEAQKVSDAWTGSSSPRPKRAFAETLHSRAWLAEQIQAGSSLSEIAQRAGSCPSAVLKVLEREGLVDHWRSLRQAGLASRREARREKPSGAPRTQRRRRSESSGATHAIARRMVAPGPCVLCPEEGVDVGHKDGNPANNDPANLERLCRKHHRQQHALELFVALDMLAGLGISRLVVYTEARKRLLEKEQLDAQG